MRACLNPILCIITSDATSYTFGSAKGNEQHLLEVCVSKLETIETFQDEKGAFLGISRWNGVTLDIDGCVESIEWFPYEQMEVDGYTTRKATGVIRGGSINLENLPKELLKFRIPRMCITGHIESAELPRQLQTFDVYGNLFSGTFSVQLLPHTLELIDVSKNQLCGSLNLDRLPPHLKKFAASVNSFSGSLSFESLPESLEALYLRKNEFSGSIDLRFLPEKLHSLDLRSNSISQERLLIGKPRKAIALNVDNAKFGGMYYAVE